MVLNYDVLLKDATGCIHYNMMNDYMFRYILQKNKKVLKGLISALLHLNPDDIVQLEITNPIDLSGEVHGKEFILDINVVMNNNTKVNLEMQVVNKYNWPERSLSYLCRSYDQLYEGHNYREVLPVIHIGFLDYTLFPKLPEFYATYMMMNVRNHHIYSDKLKLSVVNLSKIELATEEDKAYGIDYWARLFKAKTWEEIKMLAEKDEFLQEAATSIYMANADEMVRQRCRARQEVERYEREVQHELIKNQETIEEQRGMIEEQRGTIEEQRGMIEEQRGTIERNKEIIEKNKEMIKEKDTRITQLEAELSRLKQGAE